MILNLIYLLVLLAASPWLLWQMLSGRKSRGGIKEKFWGDVPTRSGDQFCVWLHAVSVGEVNLLGVLLTEIDRRHPNWQCVISATTAAGYALAKKKYADRTVFYCPLDFTWAVRRAVTRIRPNLLVLVELELWPNLVQTVKRSGGRVAIVNGRLGDRSFRGYRRIRRLLARWTTQVDLVAAQNELYAQRFRGLGVPESRVHITGSVKFDGPLRDRQNSQTQRLTQLAGIQTEDVVFLAGSTQDPEESIALDVYKNLAAQYPRLRLIIVPRHPERFDAVAQMLDASGVAWQRRSRLDVESGTRSSRVLLVDTVGELAAWWGTAQIAFVGGSLGNRGGQNMIEPAGYGAAICFGPNTWNFRDIVALILNAEAAEVVSGAAQLEQFVTRMLADPAARHALGQRAQQLVGTQAGAASRTIDLLDQVAGEITREQRPIAAKRDRQAA